MIDYGDWCLSSPPHVRAWWFIIAAREAGFNGTSLCENDAEALPPTTYKGLVVTLVRHPVEWLCSILNSEAITTKIAFRLPWHTKVREWYDQHGVDALWKIHASFPATVVQRWEDQPLAAEEFFASWDKRYIMTSAFRMASALPKAEVDGNLRQYICSQEPELCERYDYW